MIECGWVGGGGCCIFFFLPPPVYSGARCRYQGANDWKLITSHRLCGMHRALIKKQKLMGAAPPFHLSLCYIFWVRVRPPAARSAKPVSDFSFPEIFPTPKRITVRASASDLLSPEHKTKQCFHPCLDSVSHK